MPDVFISYGRQDRERVRPMAEALEEAGLDVWWDPDIPPGSDFRVETGRALKEATAVIVVWSKYSVTRHFVIDEASVAHERGVLFPVLVDVVDIPLGFRQTQTVNLTRWRGEKDHEPLRSLINAVVRLVAVKNPTPDGAPVLDDHALESTTRFTITGASARLHFLWRALLLSFIMAAGAAALTAFMLKASAPLRISTGDTEYDTELFWFLIGLTGAGAFTTALVARLMTFWTDSIFGGVSLRLASRSFVAIIFSSLILTAPLEMQVRTSNILFGMIHAQFSPDGTKIVTASLDNTARVWDAEINAEITVLRGHKGWVNAAAFSTDGRRIVTASADNTARVWDAETGEELITLAGHQDGVSSAAFNAAGTRIVTASRDGAAKIWDAKNGDLILSLNGHKGPIFSAAFSPDGKRLVTAATESANIWDVESGNQIMTLEGSGWATSAAFSPDGERVIVSYFGGGVLILDVDGEVIRRINKRKGSSMWSAVFSPDGNRILTVADDNTARIWDANTGKEILALTGHTGSVNSAAFSPDGTRIVTASGDGTAKIWDAADGSVIAIFSSAQSVFLRKTGLSAQLKFFAPIRAIDAPMAQQGWKIWVSPLLRGAGLLFVAFIAAVLIRLPLRIIFSREKLQWVRVTVFSALTLYLLLVYLTNLPPEAVFVWIVYAVAATPVLAFIRLLLAWEFRGAFAQRI